MKQNCHAPNYNHQILHRLTQSIQDLYQKISNANKNPLRSGIVQLSNGSILVNDIDCFEASSIFLTYIGPLDTSNPGFLSVMNILNGSFTIQSSSPTDSSFVQWFLYNDTAENRIAPSVQTLSVSNVGPLTIQCTGEITSGSFIFQRGFVWSSTNMIPTVLDNKEVSPGGDIGVFTLTFLVGVFAIPIYVCAFVTSVNGITYGQVSTIVPYICLAEGTLISLANGNRKPIEDIRYSDVLLVWNFDQGQLDKATPLWIKKRQLSSWYNELKFDNKTVLRSIGQHRIFNKEKGKFTYPIHTPIGTTTFTDDKDHTILLSKTIVQKPIYYYNIITDYHLNMFANGILTSCRYNNIYPIENMKFIKPDIYPCIQPYIDPLFFNGLRVSEQPFSKEENTIYITRLKDNQQMKILFLDHQGVLYTKDHPDHKTLDHFDVHCISVLNEILRQDPNIDIVVSSDWKHWVTLEEMQEFYRQQGINKQPIAFTKTHKGGSIEKQRAAEILDWVDENDIKEWVALDDLDMTSYLPDSNFVLIVEPKTGLDHRSKNKVVEKLRS